MIRISGSLDQGNGDVAFYAGDEEVLLIGFHPERNNIAVRNTV